MSIPVNDVVAIEQAGDVLITALNAGDISALSDFFAPNAILLPPARAAAKGEGLIPFLRNMALANEGLKLLSADMESLGPDAVRDTGTLSLRVKQQKGERTAFKYLMLWQRVGGTWKLSSLVWNRAPANRRAARAEGGSGDM